MRRNIFTAKGARRKGRPDHTTGLRKHWGIPEGWELLNQYATQEGSFQILRTVVLEETPPRSIRLMFRRYDRPTFRYVECPVDDFVDGALLSRPWNGHEPRRPRK